MYAVVQITGHQHKITPGQTIEVDRLSEEVGKVLTFPALLVVDEKTVKVGQEAKTVEVTATVVEHGKGDKIHIRRYRSKSRHRRHVGFRPVTTLLRIDAIGGVGQEVKKETVKTSEEKAPVVKKATRKRTKAA